ncbi:MAG: hypothetical protein M5U28_16250 [Sandaracinaceae bacterium]|nr:hypothetical protein [Sandaracinaceae bacterium]
MGSTACLVGCDGAPPVTPPDDAGTRPCPPQTPAPPGGPAPEYPPADYFDRVAADLDAAGIGTPVVFLDLDRMDANIDAIVEGSRLGATASSRSRCPRSICSPTSRRAAGATSSW